MACKHDCQYDYCIIFFKLYLGQANDRLTQAKSQQVSNPVEFCTIFIDSPARMWQYTRVMLKGISPVISPTLLKILAEMGHGDEIVLSDAHFPAHTFNSTVVRADGLGVDTLLKGIIPLFELDSYATPVIMMEAVPGDTLDPAVEAKYRAAMGYEGTIERMERYAFYERAKNAYACVISGETAKYGNIIIKKGVTPICD